MKVWGLVALLTVSVQLIASEKKIVSLPNLDAVLFSGVSEKQEMTIASGTLESCSSTYSASDWSVSSCMVTGANTLVSGDPASTMYLTFDSVVYEEKVFKGEGTVREYTYKGVYETTSHKVPLKFKVYLNLYYWDHEPERVMGSLRLDTRGPVSHIRATPQK